MTNYSADLRGRCAEGPQCPVCATSVNVAATKKKPALKVGDRVRQPKLVLTVPAGSVGTIVRLADTAAAFFVRFDGDTGSRYRWRDELELVPDEPERKFKKGDRVINLGQGIVSEGELGTVIGYANFGSTGQVEVDWDNHETNFMRAESQLAADKIEVGDKILQTEKSTYVGKGSDGYQRDLVFTVDWISPKMDVPYPIEASHPKTGGRILFARHEVQKWTAQREREAKRKQAEANLRDARLVKVGKWYYLREDGGQYRELSDGPKPITDVTIDELVRVSASTGQPAEVIIK